MKSFTGNASSQKNPTPSSYSSYQFDFGLGSSTSNSSKPLKDQKPTSAAAHRPAPATPSWASQPSKPSWTHQPAPASGAGGIGSSASMVGDIFGKSWGSAAPNLAATSTIGINKSNPNLFGDLLGSALNQGKSSNSNAPLKAAPARNSYSMGNLAGSLPKSSSDGINSGDPMKSNGGSMENFGNFPSLNQSSKPIAGQPTKLMSGAGSSNKHDPFGSLMNFGPKNSGNAPINSSTMPNSATGSGKPANFGMPAPKPVKTHDFSFGEFKNAEMNDFGIPSQPPTNQQASDPLESLFSSSGNSSRVLEGEQFSEMNDWDVGAEFGGQDHSGPTTELEALPPPPAGVTSSAAKTKGMDSYKQGQYADAIKWLSWAVALIEKNGGNADADEALTCRASCYKEVGEYKKAVADCTKVLERDGTNVSVLLQRALLYESTEKYRLGAEDLRMVLKIDPGNRLARSTIHRLNKMAD